MHLHRGIVILASLFAVIPCSAATGWEPSVVVYSADMPGYAEGIAEALRESHGDLEFVVVGDPALMSAYLAMPDTACVILVVMRGIEVRDFLMPLMTYFEKGGAAIAFQGCLNMGNVGALATDVFPVFGNGTGSFTTKGGEVVNEYIRDELLEEFADLPDSFDLLGQSFVFCQNSSRQPIEPEVREGKRTVLYRDRATSAPLILAYENEAGSRSVGFAGFMVRAVETTRNYYGKLLEDEIFLEILEDSLSWTLKGSTRPSTFEASFEQLIEAEKDRIRELRANADEARMGRSRQRVVILATSWILGLTAIIGLVYLGFVRPGGEQE